MNASTASTAHVSPANHVLPAITLPAEPVAHGGPAITLPLPLKYLAAGDHFRLGGAGGRDWTVVGGVGAGDVAAVSFGVRVVISGLTYVDRA